MSFLWIGAAVIAVALGAAYTREKFAEARDRKRFPAPGQLLDIGGRGMHLLIRGQASGPTVVIEQGAGSPASTWWAVQDEVAKFARVCTYDRAGYMWSDPAPGHRSISDRVVDLHSLLTRAGLPGPYLLVAHSFGGLLVKQFARAYPQEVAGLVLVDTPDESVLFRDSSLRFCRQGMHFQRALQIAARFGIVRLLARHMPLIPPDGAGRALCVTPMHAAACGDDMRAMVNATETERAAQAAGELKDRPLIVLAHGIAFPGPAAALEEGWNEGLQRVAQISSDSELIVAARSNHLIHVDEPERVIESIRRVHAAVRDGVRVSVNGREAAA
jgi:pimeloyl-ACP methyl ester carboxylesterase